MKALAQTPSKLLHLSVSSQTHTTQAFDVLLAENAALRKEIQELRAFRALAYRDQLTGLWNRRYFDDRLTEEVSRAGRKHDYTFTLLLIDVNDLKLVNDENGHGAGDDLLRFVGGFLEKATRAHDLVCRVGGDEFGIILPDCNSQQAYAVQGRLREALLDANHLRSSPVGLSLGAATCPSGGSLPENLLRSADAAMYADKRRQKTGRGFLSMSP